MYKLCNRNSRKKSRCNAPAKTTSAVDVTGPQLNTLNDGLSMLNVIVLF
jgi:hypothetical protein